MSEQKIVPVPPAPASGPRYAVVPHEDYVEIMGVIAAYGRFYDDDRIDDFMGLLTDDALFYPNWPGVAPDEVQGREALSEFFGGARDVCTNANVQPCHIATNTIIATATADTADVTTGMTYAETAIGGALDIKTVGHYDFQLVKERGRWSIKRWSMRYDR